MVNLQSNFNNMISDREDSVMQIDGIPIFTWRHQSESYRRFENQISSMINNLVFQQQRPSYAQQNEDDNPLLGFVFHSRQKISNKTRNKVINIINKNLIYTINHSDNRNLILRFEAIKSLYRRKGVKNPTKSHGFSFMCLALLREYADNEQFFSLFDLIYTIKKNKKTAKYSVEEKRVIVEQMRFFKRSAQIFYRQPLAAILRLYLRNQSREDVAKNELDRFTLKGLVDTLSILNSNHVGMEIDDSPIRHLLVRFLLQRQE